MLTTVHDKTNFLRLPLNGNAVGELNVHRLRKWLATSLRLLTCASSTTPYRGIMPALTTPLRTYHLACSCGASSIGQISRCCLKRINANAKALTYILDVQSYNPSTI